MSLSPVTIACPHCRREYEISIDLAKLSRITSRASCARCKKVFEVTPDRILARTPAPRSTDHRRELPIVGRSAATDVTRVRTDGRRDRRGYEERPFVRRTDDDRRDVRRPSDDRDVIRRAADDVRRDPSRAVDETSGESRDNRETRPENRDNRESRRAESRTVSRELRRADSRTDSRELRRAESRTDSRELRRADARTDSRELRRGDLHDDRRDTAELTAAHVSGGDADIAVARTLSARSARTERPADSAAGFRIPDIIPVVAKAEPSVDDPETAWLVLADPGLGALTVQQSEAASALEWLLSHAVGARREA